MTSRGAECAKRFIKQYNIDHPDAKAIRAVVEAQGYSIIEYNGISDDEDVKNILDRLGLADYAQKTRAFVYKDESFRMLFIHEGLSEEESLLALLHEEGHIFCNHSDTSIGEDVITEHEANEFVHYVLHPTFGARLGRFVTAHRRPMIIAGATVCLLAVLLVGTVAVHRHETYFGEYYITDTGGKYHKAGCIHIKNKRNVSRLTKEQYESGEYEPCGICLP